MSEQSRGQPTPRHTARGSTPHPLPPLRVARVMIEGTVTRSLRFNGSVGDAWGAAIREAMLKRGCLRDRAHKGQCLNCALLPQCGVWPLIATADPTRRQTGAYGRPYVPLPLDLVNPSAGAVPVGTRATHGVTVVQDRTFTALWGQFAAAYVRAARQVAEWGFGAPVASDGPARRGALSVGQVEWQHPVTGETQPFAADEDAATAPPLWYEEAADQPQDAAHGAQGAGLIVEFVTPLRLVAAGETRRMPDLALLIRRVGERAETLCAGLRIALPPSLALEARDAAVKIAAGVRIARDETHWEGGYKDGGLRGTITLDITPADHAALLPALRWAQALGVGKGAQAGAGRIAVRVVE